MAGGREGVDRMIYILRDQIERTMKLLGVSSLAELTPQHVTQLERLTPRALSVPAAPAPVKTATRAAAPRSRAKVS
jgi:L-lactate dehydrogenase (cytochrome)